MMMAASTTLLHKAIEDMRPKQVKLLLKAGMAVDISNNNGVTALMLASTVTKATTRCILVRTLLRYRPNLGLKDNNGHTPLSWACRYGRDDVIRQILNAPSGLEINFDTLDNLGRTFLFLASSSGSVKALRLIIQSAGKACGLGRLHVADNEGKSPLAEAFRLGHADCVRILIREAGAPLSSLIQYLQMTVNDEVTQAFLRRVRHFKKDGNHRGRALSPVELWEKDLKEYLLSYEYCTGEKLPQLERSPPGLMSNRPPQKKLKKTKKEHAKGNELAVKLFSLYTEQCTKSFVRRSFPLVQKLQENKPSKSVNEDKMHGHESELSSHGTTSARYPTLPTLPEVGSERHMSVTKRKASVRRMMSQQHIGESCASSVVGKWKRLSRVPNK